MSDIQKARDVLANWRTGAMADAITQGSSLIPLIDGTAGNPELLDAIDELLTVSEAAEHNPFAAGFLIRAERIAAAILAADDRMRS